MELSAIAPLARNGWFGDEKSTRKIRIKIARHNEQPGIPPLGLVFSYVAHMWRVMQPETEHPALYDNFWS